MSNIGEAPIESVLRFAENIAGVQPLVAQIWGARAPSPPCSYGPELSSTLQLLMVTYREICPRYVIRDVAISSKFGG